MEEELTNLVTRNCPVWPLGLVFSNENRTHLDLDLESSATPAVLVLGWCKLQFNIIIIISIESMSVTYLNTTVLPVPYEARRYEEFSRTRNMR